MCVGGTGWCGGIGWGSVLSVVGRACVIVWCVCCAVLCVGCVGWSRIEDRVGCCVCVLRCVRSGVGGREEVACWVVHKRPDENKKEEKWI